nr:MAG TPA: Alginate and motility regulator [Caudoviricetes sp.]
MANEAVKKHLNEKRHNLRVWVDKEKYERFKNLADKNGESIYFLVNKMIDDYIAQEKPAQ